MRCHWIAAAVVLCLLAADEPDKGFTYPPIKKGDTEGILTVTVPEEDLSKPATVDYQLEIRTAADTKVEKPELINGEAWNSTELPAKIDLNDDRQVVRFQLHLEQAKPGSETLPGVTVKYRKDGEEDALTWSDIFKRPRELRLPSATPHPPLQDPGTLWWILGGVVVLAVAVLVVAGLLWPRKQPPPLMPTERALRELDRLEGLGLAGPDETGWYPGEISSVVRRVLAECCGLPAPQQTTAEFLHTMQQTPGLSAELQQTVKELLERCDLAKFAAQRTPPEECRHLAALARTVVQQTAAGKESAGERHFYSSH